MSRNNSGEGSEGCALHTHFSRRKPAGKSNTAQGFRQIDALLRSPCCTILESISDGVFTIDLNRRITFFNQAAERITGFKKDQAIGQFCFDVFRADICQRRCAIDETLSSGKSQVHCSGRIISKTGEEKPISISTSILRDASQKTIGAVEIFRDLSELEALRREACPGYGAEDIVGRHPLMREIISFLPDIAESDSAVLIEGPTGSGKELIARTIHHLSPRRKGPFVAVNCAALPDTLLESELFGYMRGAFTGANRDKAGRFLLADRGTLFLDEISNTSTLFQADLLRVLQEGEFMPLGGTQTVKVDARLVTASNLPLGKMVDEKSFREDLYYRLNVVRIVLPPLRDRKQDIPLLVEHFVRRLNLRRARDIQGVSQEVLDFFFVYPFPGNIRELHNILEFAFITCKGLVIEMRHLPKDLAKERDQKLHSFSEREILEMEKIRAALDQHAYRRPEAARTLGLSRTTLWRKMKKYGISEGGNET